ncbi:MAG TPA: PEP-CTERM sorting domain-containing protein [Rariglobus sp.]
MPEPANVAALVGVAMLGFALMRRRRQGARSSKD